MMKRSLCRFFRFRLFFLCICAVSAAILLSGPAKAELFSVSDADVIRAGQQAHQEIMKQYGAWNNPAQQRRVEHLGGRLIPFTRRRDVQYRFYLFNSDILNAMATPDGSVHVSKGLATHFTDDNELQFIIGHEITHVERRHGKQQMEKAAEIQTEGSLLLIILGQQKSTAARIGMSGAAFWLNMKYSRDFEYQADEGGMRLIQRAGIDPHYGPKALTRLANIDKANPGLLEKYFGTHPLNSERIAQAKQFADRLTRKR